jgi:asparagine synthase (glutamine-hydrolysing)
VQHLIKDGHAKAVLRDAMKGIVPDAVLNSRRKVGFNAPIGDLIDLRQHKVRDYILDDGRIFEIIRKSAVERLLNAEALTNSASKFMFYFLNVKIFTENI